VDIHSLIAGDNPCSRQLSRVHQFFGNCCRPASGISLILSVEWDTVEKASPFESFPPGFPSELAVAAYTTDNEAAWPPAIAAAAVEWFGSNGYAVLGTELWLLQDGAIQSLPIGLSGMREVHGNAVSHKGAKEVWSSYVSRAAAETLAYLKSFNCSDIVEHGQIFFNVVWASESDCGELPG